MTTQLMPNPQYRLYDNLNNLAIGGQIYTYAAGTSTPLATFTDATGSTPQTNPVIMNSRGEAAIWLTSGVAYKLVAYDALNNLLWTDDQVTGAGSSSGSAVSGLSITVNTQLIAGQLNGYGIFINPQLTLTLPAISGSTAGQSFTVEGGVYGGTVAAYAGLSTISDSYSNLVSSLAIAPGQTVQFINNAGNTWQVLMTSIAGGVIGKNVVVNGDCSVSQVNGTTLITPLSGSWPIDMLAFSASQASKLQTQQLTSKLNPLGATTSISTTVLAAYTPISTDYFTQVFSIEGLNFARFQYGTANAKVGSLQFKVNATIAGTYSGAICNYASTRAYPFTFTVAANTDTQITIPNILGDTGGSWVGSTNAGAALIKFDLGSGSTYRSTSGTWQALNLTGATGSASLVSQSNGSALTVTDVQFEVGPVCTQFERKLYSQNLAESQRYLQFTCNAPTGLSYVALGYSQSTSQGLVIVGFPVYMRASPTVTGFNISALGLTTFSANSQVTAVAAGSTTTPASTCVLITGTGTPYTAGQPCFLSSSNPLAGISFSAQI